MRAFHLVCGYNYTFGANGTGDVSLLQTLCEAHNIGLTVLPPVRVGELPVSSSAIRAAMEDGRPEDAAALLGRPYSLTAPVVDGQKLARTLGFPTLNQIFPRGTLIPKAGVYATRVTLPDSSAVYGGISNVGIRPTVTDHTLCCETHLFDFSGDLYQVPVTVEFLSFLRSERKFESLEAMSEQIRNDMRVVRKYLDEQGAIL
jgi:riboflavin kinase/FMN adenylyltransferase